MNTLPEESCSLCKKTIQEGESRISSRRIINRFQKRTSISLRVLCMDCRTSIKSIDKGEALSAVVWIRKTQEQSERGIFPSNMDSVIADAKTAKHQLEKEISQLMDQLQKKTHGLNFVNSAIISLRNSYCDHLWETYPERRKRANYAISKSDLRFMVFGRDRYRCKICGRGNKLSVDHIIPVAKGGDDSLDNLQTLCKSCNSKKGDRIP